MKQIVFATREEALAIKEILDKAYDCPRAGVNVGEGRHVEPPTPTQRWVDIERIVKGGDGYRLGVDESIRVVLADPTKLSKLTDRQIEDFSAKMREERDVPEGQGIEVDRENVDFDAKLGEATASDIVPAIPSNDAQRDRLREKLSKVLPSRV